MPSLQQALAPHFQGSADHDKLDESAFSTGAPEEDSRPLSRLQSLKSGAICRVSSAVTPIISRMAKDYLGGETVSDALCVARQLATENVSNTLGFWDTSDYTQRDVAGIYLSAVRSLSDAGLNSYVSIKPPALRFDNAVAAELAGAAKDSGVRLHCDSHGPQVADASNAMLLAMRECIGADHLGTTLPGRWARSLTDADWAVEQGFAVRVVKGQWPDPDQPRADMDAGYLAVIDRLAGRARHVGVATHNLALAQKAIERLHAAGTPCELEQILGLHSVQSVRWAKENGIGVRIYIPFGKGYIPNAIGVLKRNPKFALVILKRLVRPA